MVRIDSSLMFLAFITTCIGTFPVIESDISVIANQATGLDNAVNAFPTSGGSVLSALAIHDRATALASAFGTAATDIAATPPILDEGDCEMFLELVEELEPIIIDIIEEFIAKETAFGSLPIGGIPALLEQDLTTLQTDTKTFENELIVGCPELGPPVGTFTTALDAALATAVAAYANG